MARLSGLPLWSSNWRTGWPQIHDLTQQPWFSPPLLVIMACSYRKQDVLAPIPCRNLVVAVDCYSQLHGPPSFGPPHADRHHLVLGVPEVGGQAREIPQKRPPTTPQPHSRAIFIAKNSTLGAQREHQRRSAQALSAFPKYQPFLGTILHVAQCLPCASVNKTFFEILPPTLGLRCSSRHQSGQFLTIQLCASSTLITMDCPACTYARGIPVKDRHQQRAQHALQIGRSRPCGGIPDRSRFPQYQRQHRHLRHRQHLGQ